MQHTFHHFRCMGIVGALAGALSGCEPQQPAAGATYYERRIDPIVASGCATSASGSACHLIQDTRGNALGNLSVESFETLSARRDLFVPYGPYATPNLLLKVLPPFPLAVTRWDADEPTFVTTQVAHAGGSLLDVTSVSYTELSRWLSRGATENNAIAVADRVDLRPCSEVAGSDAAFDPRVDPSTPDYPRFVAAVGGVVGSSCAAGNCHGSPANSLYLTCGSSDEQRRWNYFAMSDYVSVEAPGSEILRRALAPAAGGTFHEGGSVFDSAEDAGYRALLDWAVEKGGPSRVPEEPGFEIFASRVQPMLVKKGCMQLGCHSPAMGHDYRLRGGSAGHFSLPATRRNYELSLEQISLESENPNASRLVRKNLPPFTRGGVVHRGGSLLADSSGRVDDCDLDAALHGPLDEQSAYCVLAAWIAAERDDRLPDDPGLSHVIYVQSPAGTGPDSPQDFERFAPGADLLRVAIGRDGEGWPMAVGEPVSLLAECGLDAAPVDVRRPSVSWGGDRIAFSARTASDRPFRVYVLDDSGCQPEPAIDASPVDEFGNSLPDNGELVHNFDPVFSPDGRLAFLSTRGNVMNVGNFDYSGPQRSPADPSRLNANLYLAEGGGVRQLTFLLDQEMAPSFMADGRVIFSTEKRSPGFYQIAGRRLNLDGGDYHPLFGQRSSIGFNQLSDVVELSDRNLAAIFSQKGAARGAGTLAIVNRSLGVDQRSQDAADYFQDPAAIRWPNEDFFRHSIHLVDPRATGELDATRGAFLHPAALPEGRALASYAADATDLRSIDGSFDLVVVDPVSGERRALLSDADDLLWPAAVYARAPREVLRSRLDEPNGATQIHVDPERRRYSQVTYLDLPLLSGLLFQNTRSGRPLAAEGSAVEFWEQLPPDPGVRDWEGGGVFVAEDAFGPLYARRRLLGRVTPNADGSARVRLPGGVPFNLALEVQLEGDPAPTLHHQREANQFYPGEWARQSFPRHLFNGLCGNCHGSVSGLESDVATDPDILTRASAVVARDQSPTVLERQGSVEGPDFR